MATAGSDGFVCPPGGIRGSGSHRLFTQGNEGEADAFGVYSLMHPWGADGSDFELCSDARFLGANDLNMDGAYQPGEEPLPLGPPGIVHGEHFLVGVGAFAEFSAVLCDDITGNVTFYIPNYDESGSRAAHQLFVVHEGKETLIAETVDEEAGQSGYNPFVRQLRGTDPQAEPGDTLLLRSTNLNGIPFSVMVWRPPSEYESWIMVEVP